MAKHNHCPYCGSELVYKDIAADIDNITEKWWCPNCKEDVEFDEPGLRHIADAGKRLSILASQATTDTELMEVIEKYEQEIKELEGTRYVGPFEREKRLRHIECREGEE